MCIMVHCYVLFISFYLFTLIFYNFTGVCIIFSDPGTYCLVFRIVLYALLR